MKNKIDLVVVESQKTFSHWDYEEFVRKVKELSMKKILKHKKTIEILLVEANGKKKTVPIEIYEVVQTGTNSSVR
ncbi:MAG: hypothetical protein HY761_05285 [Candidatus Omnitrophica bacterium]|nr:hypothetical protein [Candidatus Omnitrophota bacterium]